MVLWLGHEKKRPGTLAHTVMHGRGYREDEDEGLTTEELDRGCEDMGALAGRGLSRDGGG